jgi:clorobiocin biosynthesis protein CloN6
VRVVNLSTVLLRCPDLDLDAIIDALDAPVIGIDLHWMVHVQGCLAVAERIKQRRPEVRLMLGGISSTYYADELIRYPFVDLVMRGYDTHEPVALLLETLARGREPVAVPNLVWKTREGAVRDNGMTHLPPRVACGVDWSGLPEPIATRRLPIREIVCAHTAGCSYACGWCGGSRQAFRRLYGTARTVVRRPLREIAREMGSVDRLVDADRYHVYTVGSYNETPARQRALLDLMATSSVRSLSCEQFFLPPDDLVRHMVATGKRVTIPLSPESHDRRIARLAGRGVYSNARLELWIDRAFRLGIAQVDLWYFVGMPEQDERSVWATVEYCRHLLSRFRGTRINPMICPMIPFLDPGSTFFTDPDRHGYRVFHQTVEQHRRAMTRASLVNRLNYETRWLSRRDLVYVGLRAARGLMQAKGEAGFVPRVAAREFTAQIDDALDFLPAVDQADNLADAEARAAELERLGQEIVRRNHRVLFGGVLNQAVPLEREVGGRWFDELGWEPSALPRPPARGGPAVSIP